MTSKRSEIQEPTVVSGADLLNVPLLNKGTAFTEAERRQLGLEGLLPPHVETLDEQVVRAYEAYQRKNDDLERHIYLRALQDTNEVLFYRLLLDHIEEMTPMVYTPYQSLALLLRERAPIKDSSTSIASTITDSPLEAAESSA